MIKQNMTRLRPVLTSLMSLLAICTGFTTIQPQPCVRVSPLWMQSSHRMHRQPCSIAYFQADDTALEFEDDETTVSKQFDRIKSMVYFLWTRCAVALLHTSQRTAVPRLEDASANTAAIGNSKEIQQQDIDILEREMVEQMETPPEAKQEHSNSADDEVKGDNSSSNEIETVKPIAEKEIFLELEKSEPVEIAAETTPEREYSTGENDETVISSDDEQASLNSEDKASREEEDKVAIEPTSDSGIDEQQATSDSERASTMHQREGDRAIGLKDEFLDPLPLPEAISLGFGRPLEISEVGVPPLREKSNPADTSK